VALRAEDVTFRRRHAGMAQSALSAAQLENARVTALLQIDSAVSFYAAQKAYAERGQVLVPVVDFMGKGRGLQPEYVRTAIDKVIIDDPVRFAAPLAVAAQRQRCRTAFQ